MTEYHHQHSPILIALVVVVLLLSNYTTTATTVIGSRIHPTDQKDQKLEPKVHLALISLMRVIESLNAELIRDGVPYRFVLVPLRRSRKRRADQKEEEEEALSFELRIRPLNQTMGGFRTHGMSDFECTAAVKEFVRSREAANRVKTGRPIFQFRSDPDSKKGMPESRGGTRIVY